MPSMPLLLLTFLSPVRRRQHAAQQLVAVKANLQVMPKPIAQAAPRDFDFDFDFEFDLNVGSFA